jgi:methylated-DNA-[protein]-cysteine S-methyltransferase
MSTPILLRTAAITTPVGRVVVVVSFKGVCRISLGGSLAAVTAELVSRYGPVHFAASRDPDGIVSRLVSYFAGDTNALDGIPVDAAGTAFQTRVWKTLRTIPPGKAVSYAWVARRIRQPGAVRAVGGANGRNPVPLIVPCHRVIAADGTIGGYSAGLDRKAWLLRHEGVRLG